MSFNACPSTLLLLSFPTPFISLDAFSFLHHTLFSLNLFFPVTLIPPPTLFRLSKPFPLLHQCSISSYFLSFHSSTHLSFYIIFSLPHLHLSTSSQIYFSTSLFLLHSALIHLPSFFIMPLQQLPPSALTPLLITLLSFLNILLLNSPLLPPSPSASRPLPFFFLAYPTSTSLPSLFIILLLRLIFVVLLLKLSLLPCNSASTSPLLYHFGSPPLPSFFTSFCFFTSFLLHRIVLLHVLAPSVPFWFHTPPHFLYHPVPCK